MVQPRSYSPVPPSARHRKPSAAVARPARRTRLPVEERHVRWRSRPRDRGGSDRLGLLSRRTSPSAPSAPPVPPPSQPTDSDPAEEETTPDSPGHAAAPQEPAAPSAPARRCTGRPRPAPTAKADAPPTAEEQPGDEFTSQVSVYLAADALVAVRRVRRETGRTNAEVAFAAIDATHHQLRELVARRRAGAGRPDGFLFPVRRSGRPSAGPGRRVVLWAMRATSAEVAILDRLVDEAGAASRSELIASAIEGDLLPTPGRALRPRPGRGAQGLSVLVFTYRSPVGGGGGRHPDYARGSAVRQRREPLRSGRRSPSWQ